MLRKYSRQTDVSAWEVLVERICGVPQKLMSKLQLQKKHFIREEEVFGFEVKTCQMFGVDYGAEMWTLRKKHQ